MIQTWLRPRATRRLGVTRAAFGVLVLAGILTALAPAAAQAETATTTCPATTLVQPFTRWSDENYYSLVPGGSFEAGEAAWTLSGGATVASGSEPYAVTGTLGKSSLKLPVGASAQSPFLCVEPNDRTYRFFLRAEGSSATLATRLVYETSLGLLVIPTKVLSTGSTWEVSPILHTGAALATAIKGGAAYVSLGFASEHGTARIDDVYLDPRMRR
jgi:hypothetical protein